MLMTMTTIRAGEVQASLDEPVLARTS